MIDISEWSKISFSKIDIRNEHPLGKRILLKNQEILHLTEYKSRKKASKGIYTVF